MILIVIAQIGETGPVVTVRGRDALALLELKAANDNGCTPIDHPGPRLERLRAQAAKGRHCHRDNSGKARWPLRRAARALRSHQHNNHSRNERRQVVMAIAGLQIVTGGASAPPAFQPAPMSRTITDGIQGSLGDAHAKAS